MHDRISVFLVAGNRLLREALARLLSKKGDFDVCGISPCLPHGASSIAAPGPDVLILDSVTVQLSDYPLLPEIMRQVPSVKIVLIDMDGDPEVFLDCVRAGVRGYLLKDASAADVVSGVRSVAEGQAVCPSQLCLPLFRAVSMQWTSIPSTRIRFDIGLTRRQQQLVPLIAQGLTNKEIACHLNLSEQTVKNHIHRMLRRVGARDRSQVIGLSHYRGAFR